ncbi:hypothetical protein RJT34_25579 [Clitoria ternatea]|uniref:KOW domain-containing protein n=1 Tax=Clitoria ternatea TaxID=43366 RepID=A0AAN9FWF3_CLITE
MRARVSNIKRRARGRVHTHFAHSLFFTCNWRCSLRTFSLEMTSKGKGKGKEVAGKSQAGKRKSTFDDDKTRGGHKRKNRGVLQFVEDAADVDDSDESDDSRDSNFSDDFSDDDFDVVPRMPNESGKGQSSIPFVPKEELVDEEEFDRIMEERYGDPSRFLSFTEDLFDDKTIDPSLHIDANEMIPTVWKVKCTVGRERLSACCLMQKFVDLKSLGTTTLKIISAFAVDHMKGFVYIEAEKQHDINQACHGIPGIYATRIQAVPRNEVSHLFSVRTRRPEISEGMWARIKNGNYKGDLAQVVAVNDTRKKVTVKLIPRIDLQALAAKFGGGYSRQKLAIPAPRLISTSELEEFRPLIQFRRDRDTGKVFEVLDGLMLKDGYVYKKVSPESLSLWGVVPTEEELLKFGPSENNESNELEWLSQLYGDRKKKQVLRADKGGGKGEGSSGSGVVNGFELYDLVCFGKKDFGVIVGMDKDDMYKILKEGPDGPVAITIERHEIKSGLFDLKLTAQDQHRKTIFVNDSVRVLDGPAKGKQGVIKHIYRGIVFLYDGNEEENGGYLTCKSNMCEKVKLADVECSGKESEPGPLVFDDQPSSPRSPLSPKKPWQARDNNRQFNHGDNDNSFTIGQTLRIRIGPLKGYLCRVIALRRSDVTVKLDSQQKVLTVKCEHLSEVQGKSTVISTSGDPDSSKPFDLLGTEGGSGGWMDGAGTSTGGGGWNTGGTTSERSAWSNPSAPSFLKPDSTSNPLSSTGAGNTAWETKSTSNQNSSWGAAVDKSVASDPDQSGGWGKGGSSWGQAEHKVGSTGDENLNSNSNWNTTKASEEESSGWNSVKKSNETSSAWGGWKSGTSGVKEDEKTNPKDGGGLAGWEAKDNWDAPSSNVNSGWNQKSTEDDKEGKGKDQGGWNVGKGAQESSNWGNMKSDSTAVAEGSYDGSKHSNWKSSSVNDTRYTDTGNQDSDWTKKSNLNPGSSGNQASEQNNVNWNSGSGNSTWGNNSNKPSLGAWNENKNSNWSSGCTVSGNQDSTGGKESGWNSGNSGKQASEQNNSNWNSGSVDVSQNSNWGNTSNWNSNKSSPSAGNEKKNSNWNSGHADPGNQDSNRGNKSGWNSESVERNHNNSWRGNWNSGNGSNGDKLNGGNEGSNENSDEGGGGNWRGGRGRGGFSGRGFRGRGERGGFGGRGERGGFRGGREGGRWTSDRGFGGRGRGRGDQSGSWNNRRDSSEDGSSDWKGAGSEGWKNSSGSGAWNQDAGDKKDGQSWSQGNTDKGRPGWNQGGGSNKQWQSGNQDTGDKKDGPSWSQGNADKEHSGWSQGGGSSKKWQSGSSASHGTSDGWNSNESKQTVEAISGAGWNSRGDHGSSWQKSNTIKENNIQESGWNKGSNSNTTSGGWDNKETGWKGCAGSGGEKGQSANDGTAGSWGKSSVGSDKGGW